MNQAGTKTPLIGQNKKQLHLSRVIRIILFFFLVSIEFSINISSGLFASASKIIKGSLNMNDKDFGFFGMCYGIGRVLGSLFFMLASDKFNRKYIIISFLVMKSIFLIAFKVVSGGYILILIRSLIGFTHMPPSIFVPVWIDQFGLKKYKTLQLTLLTVLIPAGKVTGYFTHVIFEDENWRMGFFIEGVYLFIVAVIIFITPYQYLSKDVIAIKDEDARESLFAINQINYTEKSKNEQKGKLSIDYCSLLKNKVYVVSVVTRALLNGVLTAFHYWISDYMRSKFNINNNTTILYSYSLIAVAGPLGGVLLNSIIVSIFGGYTSKNSMRILFCLHLCTCSCGLSIAFMNNIYAFCAISMLFLSFACAEGPFIQGTIISSVSPSIKGAAYSIANLFHMSVTSGTTPLLYGYVNQNYKHLFVGAAMLALMSLDVIAIVSITILSVIVNKRNNESKGNDQEKNAELKEVEEK